LPTLYRLAGDPRGSRRSRASVCSSPDPVGLRVRSISTVLALVAPPVITSAMFITNIIDNKDDNDGRQWSPRTSWKSHQLRRRRVRALSEEGVHQGRRVHRRRTGPYGL